MRNVTRPDTPASLRHNADQWRRDLCAALTAQAPNRNRINRCINRYKSDDTRASLELMYRGLCCYCEAPIGIVSFGHIEHRRPKSLQPEYTFDWDNFHLACTLCNHAKADKWNDDAPILDCVQDTISEHLSYRLEGGGLRWPLSHRGTTTIDHAHLNRQKLLEVRTQIATHVLDTIRGLNVDPDSPYAGIVRQELETKFTGEYGSLVKWLVLAFLHEPTGQP